MAVKLERLFSVTFSTNWHEKYVDTNKQNNHILTVGRTYAGIYNDLDGNYIIIEEKGKEYHLNRDKFGSIPVYYSIKHNLIATNVSEIAQAIDVSWNVTGVKEYLDCAYTTFGATIYSDICVLQPDEFLIVNQSGISVCLLPKTYPKLDEKFDVGRLEEAITKSLENVLSVSNGKLILNLSGGNDSSLLLVLLKKIGCSEIVTNTFYHEDWRNDFDDWYWAERVSKLYDTTHLLTRINNVSFCAANSKLTQKTKNIFHTYATAFYEQNMAAAAVTNIEDPIINGSGPDEAIIGTEKLSIEQLFNMNNLTDEEIIKYTLTAKDYTKVPAHTLNDILVDKEFDLLTHRTLGAERLLLGDDFTDYQRKFHSKTVLQDHIKTISEVASALQKPIFFPFLTNDIFDIIFGTKFQILNNKNTYKYVIKEILRKYLENEIVDRTKIGFQSPSRKYFIEDVGLGKQVKYLMKKNSKVLNMPISRKIIQERTCANVSLTERYDFLEWGIYNILTLEHLG